MSSGARCLPVVGSAWLTAASAPAPEGRRHAPEPSSSDHRTASQKSTGPSAPQGLGCICRFTRSPSQRPPIRKEPGEWQERGPGSGDLGAGRQSVPGLSERVDSWAERPARRPGGNGPDGLGHLGLGADPTKGSGVRDPSSLTSCPLQVLRPDPTTCPSSAAPGQGATTPLHEGENSHRVIRCVPGFKGHTDSAQIAGRGRWGADQHEKGFSRVGEQSWDPALPKAWGAWCCGKPRDIFCPWTWSMMSLQGGWSFVLLRA